MSYFSKLPIHYNLFTVEAVYDDDWIVVGNYSTEAYAKRKVESLHRIGKYDRIRIIARVIDESASGPKFIHHRFGPGNNP